MAATAALVAAPLFAAQPAAAASLTVTMIKYNYAHPVEFSYGTRTITPFGTAASTTSRSIPDLREVADVSPFPSTPDYNDGAVQISTSDPVQAARVGVALWSDVGYTGTCWQYVPGSTATGLVVLPPQMYQNASSLAIGQTCPPDSQSVLVAASSSHGFLNLPSTVSDLRTVRWRDGASANDSIEALSANGFVGRRASVYTGIDFTGDCYTWNLATTALPPAFAKTISSVAMDVDCSQDAGLTLGQRVFIGTNNESGALSAKTVTESGSAPTGTTVAAGVGSYTSSTADLAWYLRPVKVNLTYHQPYSSFPAQPEVLYQVVGVRAGAYSRPQCLTANRPVSGSAVALQNPPGSGTGLAATWKIVRGVATRDCDLKGTDPYQQWAIVTQAPNNPAYTGDSWYLEVGNSPSTSPATNRANTATDAVFSADPKTASGVALVNWGVSTESTASPSLRSQASLTYDSYGTIGVVADPLGPIAVWRPRIDATDLKLPVPAKEGTKNPTCTRGTGLSCMTAVVGS